MKPDFGSKQKCFNFQSEATSYLLTKFSFEDLIQSLYESFMVLHILLIDYLLMNNYQILYVHTLDFFFVKQ